MSRPGPPAQRDVGLLEEGGHRDAQRTGALLPWRQAEGTGGVQYAEGKLPAGPHCGLPLLESRETDFLPELIVAGQQSGRCLLPSFPCPHSAATVVPSTAHQPS